jgi:superfamily I DNA/RNA helicase
VSAFDSKLKPTDEQQENIDVVHSGVDTVIEAGAGTGKTSQLKMIAQNEASRRGLCIYFNREPAAQARRTFPSNVSCSTAHSIAWHAMRGHPAMNRLDGDRVTAKMLAEDYLGITKWFKTPPGRKDISTWKIASMAVNAVKRFCYSDAEEIAPWHIERIEGIDGEVERELRAVVLPFAQEIWADLQKASGFAQFNPDHYMKLWALSNPILEADFMMVDESQDTNGVLAGVIRRQDHLQRILVGDSQQRLFSWRGTVDMMSEFEHAEKRQLTQSFRFGDAVAEEANLWLEYLDAPLRLRGLSSINSRLEHLDAPDAILCRTNAAVIEQAMEAQRLGFDVGVVGGTEEIASFAAAVESLRTMGKTSHRELAMFKSWSDVLTYVRDEKPGGSFATSVNLINRYGTATVRGVAARCVDPRSADFVVSTVHKVKGMEWPKVRLDPTMMPDDASDQEGGEMSRGELMVGYVGTTRAREVLDATAVEPFHRRRRRVREASQKAAAVAAD